MHAEALPEGPKNPYGNGFIGVETPLKSESGAARVADGSKGVYWKVNNPASRHPASGLSVHLCVVLTQIYLPGRLFTKIAAAARLLACSGNAMPSVLIASSCPCCLLQLSLSVQRTVCMMSEHAAALQTATKDITDLQPPDMANGP